MRPADDSETPVFTGLIEEHGDNPFVLFAEATEDLVLAAETEKTYSTKYINHFLVTSQNIFYTTPVSLGNRRKDAHQARFYQPISCCQLGYKDILSGSSGKTSSACGKKG
jgi:hypothetical protein